MTHPTAVLLRGAATVFVVQDMLRSVEHYRDVLGFHTEFTYGQPAFYAGVERDGVIIHLQAASETKRLRMTRSRTLSSAPPMTMTVPSVTASVVSSQRSAENSPPSPIDEIAYRIRRT